MFRNVLPRIMEKVFKYGVVLLGLLIGVQHLAIGQVEVKVKNLNELRQLERTYVEIDEVDSIFLHEVPEVVDLLYGEYYGTTNFKIWKKLDEVSITKKFTFNVEEEYSDLNFMLVGELKEGSLKLKLFKPDQKLLKEIRIAPNQNQTWHKSYRLKEDEGQGFTGKWTVELSCSQASGYYQFVSSSR